MPPTHIGKIRRIRNRTLVYLLTLSEPGITAPEIGRRLRMCRRLVLDSLLALEKEKLITIAWTRARGPPGLTRCAHPYTPPDAAAAARLHDLLHPQMPAPTDIRSVA